MFLLFYQKDELIDYKGSDSKKPKKEKI